MDPLTKAIEHFSQIREILLSLKDEVHIEKKLREKLIKHTQIMTKNLRIVGIYKTTYAKNTEDVDISHRSTLFTKKLYVR